MHVRTRGSVFFGPKENVSATAASRTTATLLAASKPSAMRSGWMPRSSRLSACSKSAPARTTTPVVPSPISASWLRDSSTSSLPTWCSTSICSKMVAPSFAVGEVGEASATTTRRRALIVTSPSLDCNILSIPFRKTISSNSYGFHIFAPSAPTRSEAFSQPLWRPGCFVFAPLGHEHGLSVLAP